MKTIDFLKMLKSQADSAHTNSANEAKQKARIINSWRKAETPQYKSFIDEGHTPVEYMGYMLRKACIEKEFALEYVKNELGLYYDITRQDDLIAEFDSGWSDSVEDEEWTRKVFANLEI